jgi:hypothetical protein
VRSDGDVHAARRPVLRVIGNGCPGQKLDCGTTCPGDWTCETNQCVGGPSCKPLTCGTYCGEIGDGCGRKLKCNTCGAGRECRAASASIRAASR